MFNNKKINDLNADLSNLRYSIVKIGEDVAVCKEEVRRLSIQMAVLTDHLNIFFEKSPVFKIRKIEYKSQRNF